MKYISNADRQAAHKAREAICEAVRNCEHDGLKLMFHALRCKLDESLGHYEKLERANYVKARLEQ